MEFSSEDRQLGSALVEESMERQLKTERAQKDAHELLLEECLDSKMLPYMRQRSQLRNESFNDVEFCDAQATKLMPRFLGLQSTGGFFVRPYR